MPAPKMVLVNGVQYTRDDAERLGLKGEEFDPTPANIRQAPVLRTAADSVEASNRARTISATGTVPKQTAAQRKKAEEEAAAEAERLRLAAEGQGDGAGAGA